MCRKTWVFLAQGKLDKKIRSRALRINRFRRLRDYWDLLASSAGMSAEEARDLSCLDFSNQPQPVLFRSFTGFNMAFYWTDTAVTPQNYCQISRTHEQIKLVKENLSRKTCSSHIRVNELVKKLVKENLLVCRGLYNEQRVTHGVGECKQSVQNDFILSYRICFLWNGWH